MVVEANRNRRTGQPEGNNCSLDAVDICLLRALLDNARASTAALARRVGLSAPTVTERVRRLEAAGVIAGYRVVLSPQMLGLPLMAYIRIRPTTGRWGSIANLAQRTLQVLECHRISGQDGFLIKVQVADVGELEALLDQFVDLGETTTSIVQSSPVPPRGVALPGRGLVQGRRFVRDGETVAGHTEEPLGVR